MLMLRRICPDKAPYVLDLVNIDVTEEISTSFYTLTIVAAIDGRRNYPKDERSCKDKTWLAKRH